MRSTTVFLNHTGFWCAFLVIAGHLLLGVIVLLIMFATGEDDIHLRRDGRELGDGSHSGLFQQTILKHARESCKTAETIPPTPVGAALQYRSSYIYATLGLQIKSSLDLRVYIPGNVVRWCPSHSQCSQGISSGEPYQGTSDDLSELPTTCISQRDAEERGTHSR